MNRSDDYQRLVLVATGLALGILVTFQIYQMREPTRLQADAAQDLATSVEAGGEIYLEQCAACHGPGGEGGLAPALASVDFLEGIADGQLFSLIRSGVPGTAMPAWSQSFGGPLTDQEVQQLVSFIRAWESQEVVIEVSDPLADPDRGAEIYAATCFACHGKDGEGTTRAPALNDAELLNRFEDDWFRETISEGRPSAGMPTWGTVLSPQEIDNVVSYLATWRSRSSDAGPDQGAETAINAEVLFITNCAACHGAAGEGGVGSALVANSLVADLERDELVDFLARGRADTAMPGFEEKLSQSELNALAGLLSSWQP